jgi:hypothetical protein
MLKSQTHILAEILLSWLDSHVHSVFVFCKPFETAISDDIRQVGQRAHVMHVCVRIINILVDDWDYSNNSQWCRLLVLLCLLHFFDCFFRPTLLQEFEESEKCLECKLLAEVGINLGYPGNCLSTGNLKTAQTSALKALKVDLQEAIFTHMPLVDPEVECFGSENDLFLEIDLSLDLC